jgi:hypothetical protein
MAGSGFRWVVPPSTFGRKINQYGDNMLLAVHAVASYVGQQMQNSGRRGARWEDRTGNARGGLFYAVDGFGLPPAVGMVSPGAASVATDTIEIQGSLDSLILMFGHTVFYGKFLELSNGGRYAIVMSTIEQHLPTLERMLRQIGVG